jgi:hypothetical protein
VSPKSNKKSPKGKRKEVKIFEHRNSQSTKEDPEDLDVQRVGESTDVPFQSPGAFKTMIKDYKTSQRLRMNNEDMPAIDEYSYDTRFSRAQNPMNIENHSILDDCYANVDVESEEKRNSMIDIDEA